MAQVYKDINLNFEYINQFISKDRADKLYKECDELVWPETTRRKSITFGDEGLIYTIRVRDVAIHRKCTGWTESLYRLKQKVEKYVNSRTSTPIVFNFCAILRYPNGSVGIRKHQDKEMVLGTSICGVSLGDSRTFQLSPPTYGHSSNIEPLKIELKHGSMYCMYPPTNSHWSHEILSEENKSVRYSLTFRNVPSSNLIKEIPIYPRCSALLKSGNKKGGPCGAQIKDGKSLMCKRHS
jgi:alkylated DNA repair dioxygenase AlkB